MARTERMTQIEEMLAAEPGDVMLRYMLGMEHASAGDDAGAVTVFRELIEKEPYVPAYFMAGQALVRLQKTDEAAAMLRAGITLGESVNDWHAVGEMESLLATID